MLLNHRDVVKWQMLEDERMIPDGDLLKQIESDLNLNALFVKGRNLPVKNCWHFYSCGEDVDALFYDKEDFCNAMNRIFVLLQKYGVIIIAFCLMDTHIHFVLYGQYAQCNKFIHEYMRRTSMELSRKYNVSHKTDNLKINYQELNNELYLKTAICYVIKNPISAGLPFMPWDYPWSSGPLYFRIPDLWTSPSFLDEQMLATTEKMPSSKSRKYFKTHDAIRDGVKITGQIVSPGEYVAYEICEKIFRTIKSYAYFLFKTKDIDVESISGELSMLSIPIQELRQHRNEICMEVFGGKKPNRLGIRERILLAKRLRSKYNSSVKQIARVCGLAYAEVKEKI